MDSFAGFSPSITSEILQELLPVDVCIGVNVYFLEKLNELIEDLILATFVVSDTFFHQE